MSSESSASLFRGMHGLCILSILKTEEKDSNRNEARYLSETELRLRDTPFPSLCLPEPPALSPFPSLSCTSKMPRAKLGLKQWE